MRVDPSQYNPGWDEATFVERESETHIYFKVPAAEVPTVIEVPPVLQGVRNSFEVTDRFQVPMIAAQAQRPSPFRVERTSIRRKPRSMVGLGFAVVCVMVGIALGGGIAVGTSSWRASAAPATAAVPPAQVKMTAMPAPVRPEPIVTPIEAPPPVLPAVQPKVEVETTPLVAHPVPVPVPVHVPVPTPTPIAHHSHHAAAGSGTLAVSAKPPCSIVIDGKATGLVSPQRSISLSAGTHEVTLINAEEGIHLTAEVTVTADKATQLIQDFTK
jgi:hypothetical protein